VASPFVCALASPFVCALASPFVALPPALPFPLTGALAGVAAALENASRRS
jgi:hypothetical protein